jgi:hypothetical protein
MQTSAVGLELARGSCRRGWGSIERNPRGFVAEPLIKSWQR